MIEFFLKLKLVCCMITSFRHDITYVVCLKSSVNGTKKQTKQNIQTN
jgi:hypothetical protein